MNAEKFWRSNAITKTKEKNARGCPSCGGTAGFHLSVCTKELNPEEKEIQRRVYDALFDRKIKER